MGGPVPHSYFFKNRPKYDKTDKQKLFLARGEKERLEYFVEETGSNLRYSMKQTYYAQLIKLVY